jgi:hypothetical protein
MTVRDAASWDSPASVSYSESGPSYIRALYFILFVLLVLSRFVVGNNILDLMIHYTTDGGSIIEKIHFSTFGLFLVAILAFTTLRIELTPWEYAALKSFFMLTGVIVLLTAFMWLTGHAGSAGYLIDTYVAACITGVLMLAFPPRWREQLGAVLIAFMVISAAVAIGEFFLKRRLLPYPLEELSFRPTGLTNHPLELGLLNAATIAFVPLTRWPRSVQAVAIVVLLVGTFAAGARLASVVAAASVLIIALMGECRWVSPRHCLTVKAAVAVGAILIMPIAASVLSALGFGERFEQGLFDSSAMARVQIYGLFGLVGWSDILLGTDIDTVRKLAAERFDLDYIESSLVMFIFQFGLFGALLFIGTLLRTFVTLLRGASGYAVLGTCVFFIISFSNNALSTKQPVVMFIVTLVLAFHRPIDHDAHDAV